MYVLCKLRDTLNYHVYVIDLGEKKSSKMNSMKNIEIKGFEPENFSEESAEKGESCLRLIKVREKSGPMGEH